LEVPRATRTASSVPIRPAGPARNRRKSGASDRRSRRAAA
jgi:hypothetical protein